MTQGRDQLVVDASVAVKWHLITEEDAEHAKRLLLALGEGTITLFAPEHIRYEVPSAITVATRGANPRLTAAKGRAAVSEFLALPLWTVSDDELVTCAYEAAQQYGIAFYDGLYVALAQRLSLPMVMADTRLHELVRHLPGMLWITDWRPAH